MVSGEKRKTSPVSQLMTHDSGDSEDDGKTKSHSLRKECNVISFLVSHKHRSESRDIQLSESDQNKRGNDLKETETREEKGIRVTYKTRVADLRRQNNNSIIIRVSRCV